MALYRQVQQLFDPIYAKQRRHVTWGKLTVAIQKFDLLMQTEEKELNDSLEEITIKKMEYLQSFIQYKHSIGKYNKEEVLKLTPKQVEKFFQKGYKEIICILNHFRQRPDILSRLLTHLPVSSFTFCSDMALNLVGLYNSSYLMHQQTYKQSEFSLFIDAILKDWKYSEVMDKQSMHSQIVLAIFQLAQAKKFIEGLYKKFNKAVVQELIEQKISIDCNKTRIKEDVKQRMLKEQQKAPKQKQSFFGKLFRKTKKTEKQSASQIQQSIQEQTLRIQTTRIQNMTEYLKRTIKIVLQVEVPGICKFHIRKINKKLNSNSTGYKDIGNILIKHWIIPDIKQKLTQSNLGKQQELHQMLGFVQMVFVGHYDGLKIDNYISIHVKQEFQKDINNFYKQIVDQEAFPKIEVFQSLLNYQNSLKLLSFRDIVVMVNLIKAAQQKKDLEEPLLSLNLLFSEDSIYQPKNKISFKHEQYYNHNIYFCIPLESEEEYIKKSYLGSKTPLSDLPSLGETLLRSKIPVNDALRISGSLDFLKNVESKLIVKAFEGLQTNYPNLPAAGIPELESILTLDKKVHDLFQNKILFLRFKQILIGQFSLQKQLIESYVKQVKAEQIYKRYVKDVIQNTDISIFITVQSHKIKVESTLPQKYKKLKMDSILMTKKYEAQDQNVMNQILENSWKQFKKINKLLEAISKLDVTKKAFVKGEGAEEFNESFRKICVILHKSLDANYKPDKAMIDLPRQKKMFDEAISKIIVQNVYKHHPQQKTADMKFLERLKNIDVEDFKKKQLSQIPIEDFAFEQAVRKFKGIDDKESPQAKLAEFDILIRQIFKMISLSIPKQKITAEIITPVVQYIVLKAQAKYSFRSAREIRCLCIQESNYLITLWRSALTYLKDVSKKEPSITISSTSITSKDDGTN